MKTIPRSLLIPILVVGVSGSVVALLQPTNSKNPNNQISEIAGYTSWSVANSDPTLMAPDFSSLCIAPASGQVITPSIPSFIGTRGPHEKKWLRVFVNEVGKEAMLTQKYPRFPVGTVIVKQKLPSIPYRDVDVKTDTIKSPNSNPELLTVMIKREAGYNRENGDWEFMATDGKGETVSARGKLPSCQGCHKPYAKTDYIVRSYLPVSVMKALKDLNEVEAKPESEQQKTRR